MRGRRVVMDSLVSNGVSHIFGNPGTTETPLLNSLVSYPQIEYVMTLHEGVAVGAASFHAQATGRAAVANLHVAPGLGNAIGAIYGALKANSPLVVTAGQQDTRMRLANPVLGHDLVAMAAPVTKWSVQVERADELAPVLRRAFKVATDAPRGPVFVSLPINVLEQETTIEAIAPDKLWRSPPPDPAGIEELASLLLKSQRPAIVAGDDVARSGATQALVALTEAIGAPVWFEGLRAHAPFPTSHPNYRQSLPADAAQVRKALSDTDLVLLLGGPFFEDIWYAEGSHFPDGAVVVQIEESPERLAFNHRLDGGIVGDMAASIASLAKIVSARQSAEFRLASERRNQALAELSARDREAHRARLEKAWNREPSSMARVTAELRRSLPDNVVIVDESITASLDLARSFDYRGFGDYFGGRGGGIGQGFSGAIGVKVAMPDRPVVAVSGDGSAMYSIQALWTAAHHKLAIVFVILSNREYRILKHNVDVWRQNFEAGTQHPYQQMDLTGPDLDFVHLAAGMGVEGVRVEKAGDIAAVMERAIAGNRPYLVEIAIEGKR
ncbi:thiamine pyrophosphate-binding protein [Bradyrhizobium sp. JYMT SZCCT0428]|uniref:thiamine pyrophosphate-binding protein n=1 Tax=Bradyrhizobium sp. JYMT SZCCT0428 TaxID=2807673 RepID=UPI001BA4BDD8|nr:thiamine pyrophosphate-dependent enzyme [Bradyrhizobium sp. JYMT SZCCT0428]MBR1152491.1 thiamine pyrophosphate-binding protein [Bradyrhizobium sp. JYMT SZCCT0428]